MSYSVELAMSNGAYLPEETLFDILSRLPVKSLCRFKCVSSPWRTLISDPRFVKTHLNRNNKRERAILISDSFYSVDCTEASNNDVVTATKLDFPSIDWMEMGSSCNGLILVVDRDQTKFLWNPSTREFKELPKSPFALSVPRMYGFGYDSSLDEYKVVQVSQYTIYTFLSVYTLRTNSWSWRCIQDFPYQRTIVSHSSHWSGVLVNGSLHWLSYKSKNGYPFAVICAFDITEEKFRDIPVPSSLDNYEKSNDLGVLGGCLTVLVCRNFTQTDVWVMKEYWVTETWTKFTICFGPLFKPLCILVDGVVLLEIFGNLVAYNFKEETSREIMVHEIPPVFGAMKTYVESLISPHDKCGIERKYEGIENLKRKRVC